MTYSEHLKNLQENFTNPVKGIPINLPSFWPYYKYFEKGHRILLCSDTGCGCLTIAV
jgi:hypothetical protein